MTSRLFFKLYDSYMHHQLAPEYHNTLHGLSSSESAGYAPSPDYDSGYYAPSNSQQQQPATQYAEEYESYPPMPYYPSETQKRQPQAYNGGYSGNGELLEYM